MYFIMGCNVFSLTKINTCPIFHLILIVHSTSQCTEGSSMIKSRGNLDRPAVICTHVLLEHYKFHHYICANPLVLKYKEVQYTGIERALSSSYSTVLRSVSSAQMFHSCARAKLLDGYLQWNLIACQNSCTTYRKNNLITGDTGWILWNRSCMQPCSNIQGFTVYRRNLIQFKIWPYVNTCNTVCSIEVVVVYNFFHIFLILCFHTHS